jgi:hypothetical protein
MKNYSVKQLLTWTVIVIVVVALSATVSYLITSRPAAEPACCADSTVQTAIHAQLGLTPSQEQVVDSINMVYRAKAGPLADSIREMRSYLLAELRSDSPSPGSLDSITFRISMLQHKLQQENIRQYLGLKNICTPEQAERLSAFFHDLYQCPMKESRKPQHHGFGRGKQGSGHTGRGRNAQ